MLQLIVLLSLMFLLVEDATAYVGPGLGLGVIGVIFGVIAAVLLGIIGLVWYPFKRLLKKKKLQKSAQEQEQEQESN
jgi:cellobiose-specific phosphotransferase system component IIC